MDADMRFRTLLLKLQDSLSDVDRQRLHFLIGSIIPRRLRDDPTINGTLNLLESLFDRGKITDQEFDFLIEAFEGIDRHDIAWRLRAHAQPMGIERVPPPPSALPPLPTLWSRIASEDTEKDKVAFCKSTHALPLLHPFPETKTLLPQQLSAPASMATLPTTNERVKDESSSRQSQTPLLLVLVGLGLIAILSVLLTVTWLINRKIIPTSTPAPTTTVTTALNDVGLQRNNRVVLGYFTSWSIYGRHYYVSNITADRLTHLSYAFAGIDSNGELNYGDQHADTLAFFSGDTDRQPLRGNFNQLRKLKEKHPHLRTLISVGGDAGSGPFHYVAATSQNRSVFAKSCLSFLGRYNFDGIDLFWQYPVLSKDNPQNPHAEDKQNYVLLVQELRRQLDTASEKKYLLTIVGGVDKHISNLNLPSMIHYLDWINVLTYNFHSSSDSISNHHAPLYGSDEESDTDLTRNLNVDATIQAYVVGGAPESKLVMGIPLYGYGWKVKSGSRDGRLQPSITSERPNGTWEAGNFDYDHLKRAFLPSYTRHFDSQSKATSLFNASTGIWISYEDGESLASKNNYILVRRLRGAHFWELSADRQAELVTATYKELSKGVYTLPDNLSPFRGASSTDGIASWKPSTTYQVGDRVRLDNRFYRCIRRHASTADLTPSSAAPPWQLEPESTIRISK